MLKKLLRCCYILCFLLCQQEASAQLAGGTYTINSANPTAGTNFQSFTAAAAALNGGITGPVTINVVPNSGPYNEQFTLLSTVNSNAINTLTINGNNNAISFNITSSPNPVSTYTFGLNGADYVTVHDLNVTVTGTTAYFTIACQLWNQADHNKFVNCTFDAPFLATSMAFLIGADFTTTIASNTYPTGSYNILDSCTVRNIYFRGVSTSIGVNNQLLNSHIEGYYDAGMYVSYQDSMVIRGNVIERTSVAAQYATAWGITIDYSTTNALIEKNIIRHPFGGGQNGNGSVAHGIRVKNVPSTASIKIYNNLIYGFEGNGDRFGLSFDNNAQNVHVYNNTIVLDNTASTAGNTYGIYSTVSTGMEFINNNISITRSGTGTKYCLYYAGGMPISNYNNLYINTPAGTNGVGYYNTGQSTLINWQTTGMDANSVSVDPQFLNALTGNYEPYNAALDDLGTPVSSVTDDINGNIRSTITPDIGAYEFLSTSCSNPVAGTAIASAPQVCLGQNVNLSLSGNSVGVGQTYQWESSTNFAFGWTPEGGSQAMPPITVTPWGTGINYYRCGVTCGSTTVYSDTMQVSVPVLFPGGTYTINSANPTGGNNFQSFNDAVAAISCGIAGSVIFNVASNSGPYSEQVTLPATIGSDATKTVTFNGNGNTLTYDPSLTQTAPYTFGMDGVDYISVHDLNIIAAGGAVSYAMHLWNGTDNDSFVNCIMQAPLSSNSNQMVFAAGGSASNAASGTGSTGNNNVISSCTIRGGYYGIAFLVNSSNPDSSNKILNCNIENFYLRGISLSSQDSLLISGNRIERPDSINVGNFCGIYMANSVGRNCLIEKNIIRRPYGAGGTGTVEGITFLADASSGMENKIYNNLLDGWEGNGTQYGIYLQAADYVQAYHNTIVLDNALSTGGTTRGLYSTTGTGNDIKNNNIYITRGGTGDKYCLYFTGGAQTSDFNNLYINSPAGTNGIGYLNTGQTILANWQTTGKDISSISIDPQFVNPSSGNYEPSNPAMDNLGVPLAGVTDDINGSLRSTTAPDMGAYEFSIPLCSNPVAGTVVSSAAQVCLGGTVNLNLTGNSVGSGQTYQWESATSLFGTWTPEGSSLIAPPTTVTTWGTTYYRCAVTCGSTTVYSDTIQILVPGLFPGGTYTINSAQPTAGTNFQSFNDAVLAISCGIAGSVTFNVAANSGPYNEQVTMPSTIGSDAFNTVTMNGNGNALMFDPSLTLSAPYTLGLDGINYVTIYDLNIAATGGTTASIAVRLWNHASNDSFVNCNFTAPLSSGTDVACFAAGGTILIPYDEGDAGNNNVVQNCVTNGGYYSVLFSGASANPDSSNIIQNCTVKNFYRYGIHGTYQDDWLVSENTIERPDSSIIGDFSGIVYNGGAGRSTLIEKNIIRHPFGAGGTGIAYGIHVLADAVSGSDNKIYNNLIYGFEGGGTQYGMYLQAAGYVQVYHNTIILDNALSTVGITRGIYSTTGTGNDIENNNIYITRGGTGAKYCLYFTGGAQTSNTTTCTSARRQVPLVSAI